MSAPAVTARPAEGSPSTRRPTSWVIAVLCTCGTVVALQQTLVVPLLPDFPSILHTSPENASWLVTVTLLTSAVGTPIVARLADMFGKRLMMIVCLVAVVLGSVTAALSASLLPVVLGRGLQGLGAALIPVGISIMRDELPHDRIGSAVALMSATLGIGGAIGMPLAGVITEHLSWHWLFWLSAIFGSIMLAAVVLVIPESDVRTRGRFDYGGAILLSIALTALLLAITKGGEWGWTSERTLGLFVLAAVVLAAWAPWELGRGAPLVDLRTSVRRPVLLTNVASVLIGFAMFGNMLSTTQQLQMPEATGYGFGLSVVAAGLAMLPGGLSMVAFAPVSATITRRWGARSTLITGALVIAGGYVARVFLTDAIWQIILGATIVSIGTAIAYAAMPTLIMRSVPITETASANGLNTLLRAIGTSTSSATVAALLAASTVTIGGVALPRLDAFQHIYWFAALAALASAAVAVAIPSRLPSTAPVTPGAAAQGAPVADTVRDELKAAGRTNEVVVRGVITGAEDRPVRGGVVTILTLEGEHVDWSRADHDGSFSVVLPGADRYVVICSADGWRPESDVMELADDAGERRLRLSGPLSLSGTVTTCGAVAEDVLVLVTRRSGESVGSARTDSEGRFEMTLPPAGRYVVTCVDASAPRSVSRAVLVGSASQTLELEIGEDAPSETEPAR